MFHPICAPFPSVDTPCTVCVCIHGSTCTLMLLRFTAGGSLLDILCGLTDEAKTEEDPRDIARSADLSQLLRDASRLKAKVRQRLCSPAPVQRG